MDGGFLVTSDGTRLWFERRAGQRAVGSRPQPSAPLVVLCGPGGRNAACWPETWLPRLTVDGFDVLRFDWRGQGRSDWDGAAVDVEVFADDVEALCAAAHTGGPLLLVGAGFGGRVALEVARRRADRAVPVDTLVLVGTSAWYADPALPGPSEPVVVGLVLRRRGGGADELLRSVGREVALECGGDGPLDGLALAAEVEGWLAHGFNPQDAHRVSWLAAPSCWDALEGLAPRVVVVHGERDPVVPMVHGQRLAERSGGRLVVVPEAGHHLGAALLDALAAAIAGR